MAQISYGTITITDTTDIDHIDNFYLITTFPSGVDTTDGEWGEWSPIVQTPNEEKPFLWNYEKIMGTGNIPIAITSPHIIGMFSKDGTNGTPGESGRGITEIQDYYLATDDINVTSIIEYVLATETEPEEGVIYYIYNSDIGYEPVENPTQNPAAEGWYKNKYNWSTQVQLISENDKYLWNYERIVYTDDYEEILGPRLLGSYGEPGKDGVDGQPGTSSYVWIKYSENADGSNNKDIPDEQTKYIGICYTTENECPLYSDSRWNWSKYIGEDGSVTSRVVSLYYLKTDNSAVPSINNGEETYTKNNSIFSIATFSVVNQWTTVIPSYQDNGIYYTCIQTFLNTGLSPVYSSVVENPSLTESKQDIQGLLTKTAKIIQKTTGTDVGLIVAGGEITEANIQNNIYGYNSIAAPNYFGLRYNTNMLARFATNGLTFYNPNQQPQIILNTDGLTINNTNGEPVAQYGDIATIGDPQGIRITIGNDTKDQDETTQGSAIRFWLGEDNLVAYMNSDVLGIKQTLAFDNMNIGQHWIWDYDEEDGSFVLRWAD